VSFHDGDIAAIDGTIDAQHAGIVRRVIGGRAEVALTTGTSTLAPASDLVLLWTFDAVRDTLGVRFMTSKAELQFTRAAVLGGATLTEAQAEQIRRDVEGAIAKVKRQFLDHRVTLRWLHNLAEPRPVIVVIREHRGNEDTATALEILRCPASAADFLRREARIPAVAGSPPPVAPCGGRHAGRVSSRPQDQRTRQKPTKRTRK